MIVIRPRRDLLRTKLPNTLITELSDGLREQPAQILERLRLRVMLGEVHINEPGERQRGPVPFARRRRSNPRSSASPTSRSD
jgi:hypothetical protein